MTRTGTWIKRTGRPRSLDDFGDLLNVTDVCAATGMSSERIRKAIQAFYKDPADPKGLRSFIPGGAEPGRGGREGYLVRKADLQAWFLGEERPDAPAS